MNYTLQVVTTKADCDAILTLAGKEKADLDFKKVSLQRQIDEYSETSVEVDQELRAVEAELAALSTIIAALPEGESKKDSITKQKRYELKQRVLNDRKANYGAIALMERQFSLARVEHEITEASNFVALVESHKSTLPA